MQFKMFIDSLHLINEFLETQAPKFPITPVIPIHIPGFSSVLVKDESKNPTWTHKDRMAREIVSIYKEIILQKLSKGIHDSLPHFSIISAGSAAYAIQTQLKQFWLPALRVLLDTTTPPQKREQLRSIWCLLYFIDFQNNVLSSEDILIYTDNINWFDITSNKAFDGESRFYDWLSYEIINEQADFIFVPYGTGQLFENIITINKHIVLQIHDTTLCTLSPEETKNTHYLWSTTNDPLSKATKLYAPFRPFTTSSPERVKLHALRWFCGNQSQIYEFEEKYLDEAMHIFQNHSIQAERSAVAWLALFLQKKDQIDPNKKILIVSTGKSICS